MNISHKKKWIYIAISKSGSSSMGALLKEHADENYMGSKKNRALGHHSTISQAKDYIEAKSLDFNEYFTFTLARNPWSREFSRFNYQKDLYHKHVAKNTFTKLNEKRQNQIKNCSIKYPDFKSYFLNLNKKNNKNEKNNKFRGAKKYLTINNEMKVKYVAKLENLDESLCFLSEKIRIDLKNFPYKNSREQERKELYEIYDEEMIKASLKLFDWEIKNLGYNFDSCANIKC